MMENVVPLFFVERDSFMRSKITVVGAGFVGSTLVQRLAEKDYADVVMYDIVPNMPQGKALDMLQAGPVLGYDSLVTGTNDMLRRQTLISSWLPLVFLVNQECPGMTWSRKIRRLWRR